MVLSSAAIFFSKSVFFLFFQKKFPVISVECQAVRIHIMPVRSDLGLNCLQRLSADDTSKYTEAHVFVLRIRVSSHFQCVVRTYDLKCVENANQLVSTQGKIMNIHMRW